MAPVPASARRRVSSSRACAGDAPFCAAKTRAASTSGTSTSHATRVGAGSSASTSSKPEPPSTFAVPPSPTYSSRGFPTARMSSPSPRLEAANGSSRRGSSGIASAASSTAVSSARTSQRAIRGSPNASETSASRQSPPSAECSTSSVPSPAVRNRELVHFGPRAQSLGQRSGRLTRRQDAFEASRTGERARARHPPPLTPQRAPGLRAGVSACAASGITLSIANESPSRARKIRPMPIPTDASIAWRPNPNAMPFAFGTP